MDIKLNTYSDSPSGDFRFSIEIGSISRPITINPDALQEQLEKERLAAQAEKRSRKVTPFRRK